MIRDKALGIVQPNGPLSSNVADQLHWHTAVRPFMQRARGWSFLRPVAVIRRMSVAARIAWMSGRYGVDGADQSVTVAAWILSGASSNVRASFCSSR
jgi:hypothetical protein